MAMPKLATHKLIAVVAVITATADSHLAGLVCRCVEIQTEACFVLYISFDLKCLNTIRSLCHSRLCPAPHLTARSRRQFKHAIDAVERSRQHIKLLD